MSMPLPTAPRRVDVAIVGGGFAGSLCAAMLGRAGIDAVLADPHPIYPPDFRCEKLDNIQLQTLELTGLSKAVVAASTPDPNTLVARFGRMVDKRPGVGQRGILYDTLVNTVRSQIPERSGVSSCVSKVAWQEAGASCSPSLKAAIRRP